MFKKIIVSFLCAVIVIGIAFGGVGLLYFAIPSKKAEASISLPRTVEDSETASAESTTESSDSEGSNVYVADVYQSLTLRAQASSDSESITDLTPMTHLEVLSFVEGTDYAYVEVLSGDKKSYKGYVNSEYITKLGEPTVRVGAEE